MLFVSQEERRARDTVLFTSENNDIANQSVDTSFFTSENLKKSYRQSAGFSSAKRLVLSRRFFARKSRYVYNNATYTISNIPALSSVVSLARLGSWGLDRKLGGNVLLCSSE